MDVEKAREAFTAIIKANRDGPYNSAVARRADEALRALDGECGEGWTVVTFVDGSCVTAPGRTIAKCLSTDDARRIARLPALEKAADELVRRWDTSAISAVEIDALRTALKQEG